MKEMNLFGETVKKGDTMLGFESIPMLLQSKKYGIDVGAELAERENHIVDTGLKGLNGEMIVFTAIDALSNEIHNLEKLFQSVLEISKSECTESILLEGFYSATIEGAKTTIEEVKRCFSNPKSKSDRMVVNSYKAIAYMRNKTISEYSLLDAWKILVDDVCENKSVKGTKYRSGMVTISDSLGRVIHTPAKPEDIQEFMDLLFDYLQRGNSTFPDSFVRAIIAHFYFVYIHPMCDGNGRLARLLMLMYMNEHGYHKVLNLTVSKSITKNISGYYNSFIEAEKQITLGATAILDVTPVLAYMLQVFRRSLLAYTVYNTTTLSEKEFTVVAK